MNKIILLGKLTKDLELIYSHGGTAIAKTTIAVNKKVNGENKATYIKCKLLGRLAEVANQYLSKGSKVLFEGEFQISDYIDENGVKKQWVEILVQNMEMIQTERNRESNKSCDSKLEMNETKEKEIDLVDVDSENELPF